MAAAKKVEARIRKLKEKAFELLSSEKYDKAVEIYVELSQLSPKDGEWPRRAADCYWHLKQPDQRLKYSLIAARAYGEARLMLKAIAMCKVVLSIDPEHRETQERLAELHSLRPQRAKRAQPAGVKRVTGGRTKKEAPKAAPVERRNSLRPVTKEGENQKASKARARLAAATALRQARAQIRKEAIAETRARRANRAAKEPQPTPARVLVPDPRAEPSTEQPKSEAKSGSSDSGSVLGRVALKPVVQRPGTSSPKVEGPPSSAFPDPPPPLIPSLHLGAIREITPAPGLAALRLSERVPAMVVDSVPPAAGGVYSLSLDDIPDAELRAARIPVISAPADSNRDLTVAVVDPGPEEPPPVSIPLGDPHLYAELSDDRSSLADKSFEEIPLLSELAPNVLRQLITDVAMIELDTNEVLFNEGDTADAMYVVVEGSVTAVTLPHGEKPIQLAHLGEGDFFGEIGLMSDQPRGATVQAHEPCRLLRFDRDIVAVLVDQDPGFLATLLQFLKDRLVEDLMMSSPLFAPFNPQERYDLAEEFEFLEIEPESLLLEEEQVPIGMYVLLTGEAHMRGASEAGTIRKLGPGDIFGEQALLNSSNSLVQVKTITKCFALCLPSDAFPEVIMTHPTVLEYLATLSESSKGEVDVAEDFLDHIRFF
jgi:cAMP-dependent protein kinase regulator